MTQREHRLVWSTRYQQEREAVLAECQRVAGLGGSFEIVNRYYDGVWTSFITIYYPPAAAAGECET